MSWSARASTSSALSFHPGTDHTAADPQLDSHSVGGDGCLQGALDALRDPVQAALRADVLAEDAELVPADPPEGVTGAHLMDQPSGNGRST